VDERIYGEDHYLRPNMIQPYRCKNVLIDSVTIKNSPMWHIHPVLCANVTIQNVTVIGHGPNNDGCNPESCQDVLVRNCYFDTGDDCIAIKSGRNADGRRVNVPTENVVIQNCTMKDGHGGVVIGSEISGSCRNIFAEDCYMNSPNLNRALRIKTNSMRGGVVENIYLRNITVGEVSEAAIKINFYYGECDIGSFAPIVRNIEVRNMTVQKTRYVLLMRGYERSPISNVRIIDSEFNNVNNENSINEVQNLVLQNVSINVAVINKIINPINDNLGTVEKINDETNVPGSIRLFQVYPNPFNPATTIQFQISKQRHVSLTIYNSLGQEVEKLIDRILPVGYYTTGFNAAHLPGGLYMCSLNTSSEIITNKMILIK